MSTSGKSILRDSEFTHTVTVRMEPNDQDIQLWNEMCALAVDLFGLPGYRYITNIIVVDNKYSFAGDTAMDWIFREEHDALLFRLKFSEYVYDNA